MARSDLSGVYRKIDSLKNTDLLVSNIQQDMDRFVPKRSGKLRRTSIAKGNSIHYRVPYASKMFYNTYHRYTTPGTGSRWDKRAKAMYMSKWLKEYVTRAMR